MRLILLTLALACSLGCKLQSKSEDKDENYRYQYSSNGCNTGIHEFSDKSSWCTGLRDESRNSGCAAQIRQQVYRDRCSEFSPEATIAERPKTTVPTLTYC